jgi:uncharacterized protein YgiM (DUF1202 family)
MGVFDSVIDEINKKSEDQQEEEIQEEDGTEEYEDDGEEESEEEYYYTVATRRDPLNCRKGPGKNYQIIGQFEKGERVKYVKEFDDDWYMVTNGDLKGYVSTQYLQEEE